MKPKIEYHCVRVRSPTNIETGNKIHSRGLNVIRLQDHREIPYSKTRVGSKTLSVLTNPNGANVAKNQQKSRPSVPTELDKNDQVKAHSHKISS